MNYRVLINMIWVIKNICTKCRISLSRGAKNYESYLTDIKPALHAEGKMYYVNEKFEAPKKCNDKEWKLIEFFINQWL